MMKEKEVNQGQMIGPAMLLNVIMRWPRATPIVALCGYTAAAFAGVAPLPNAVTQVVEQAAKPSAHVVLVAAR